MLLKVGIGLRMGWAVVFCIEIRCCHGGKLAQKGNDALRILRWIGIMIEEAARQKEAEKYS